MSPQLREPLDLVMPDEWAGTTCVVANVLYMCGKASGNIDLKEIDKLIGRKVGDPRSGADYELALLRAGLNLTSVNDWDAEKATGPNGLDYVNQYEKTTGLPRTTAKVYEDWRNRAVDWNKKAQGLKGKFTNRVVDLLTPRHLTDLAKSALVIVSFDAAGPRKEEYAVALVYGVSGNILKVFSPSMDKNTSLITTWSVGHFWARRCKGNGLMAISK